MNARLIFPLVQGDQRNAKLQFPNEMNKLCFSILAFACSAAFGQTFILTTSPVSIPAGSQPFSLTINFGSSVSGTPAPVPQATWAVRWNGSPRPTTFTNSSGYAQVTATISTTDVVYPGFNEITVMDQATGVVFPAVSWFLVSASVAANDLAYDSVRSRFYVSVPSGMATAGAPSESIVSIDSSTGAIADTINVGSKPTLLAISDDSTYLYVYNSGSASISRITLANFSVSLQIPLQSGMVVSWMAVVPGTAGSIATIQTSSIGIPSIVVYDNANIRSSAVSTTPINRFVFGDSHTLIAGSPFNGAYLEIWKLSSTAVTYSTKVSGSTVADFPVAYADGLVLGFTGNLYDITGTVPTESADYGGVGAFIPGQSRWIVGGNGSSGLQIGAFDEHTMTPLGRLAFIGQSQGLSSPTPRILAWGSNGVAFISNNQLYWGHTELAAPAPQASAAGMVNAATLQTGAIAPGEILSIFGTNLGVAGGRTLEFSSLRQVSTDLAETQVWFDGIPGTMLYASAGQLNVVAPFELAEKASTRLQIWYQGIPSTSFVAPVTASSPGIFTQNGSGKGAASILNADYSLNTAAQPAPSGSIVSLYATGGGATSPLSLDGAQDVYALSLTASAQVTLNGTGATVLYAGSAPGLVAGVVQVNFQIPPGFPASSNVALQLSIGGQLSASGVTMSIR
jgi:uncharacterized protein (TIGR03437 family)